MEMCRSVCSLCLRGQINLVVRMDYPNRCSKHLLDSKSKFRPNFSDRI